MLRHLSAIDNRGRFMKGNFKCFSGYQMALTSMSGKKAKMGDFMKQKWPCILTCNLDTNQVKNVIFVRKSS